jgi:outer membrane biosynthesis protein TonB
MHAGQLLVTQWLLLPYRAYQRADTAPCSPRLWYAHVHLPALAQHDELASVCQAAMENIWNHRRVAETAAKSCMVCYKPSTSVLITPDNKDFFYICPSHLKDRNFAVPTDDEAKAMADKKKKEDLDREIEAVKKEFEEKMKKKQQKKDKKDKDKDAKDKEKDDKKSDKDEQERDDKIKALTDKSEASSTAKAGTDDGPRVFRLQKHFYNMRLEKMRNAEAAKRNLQRLKNPSLFPSVPSGLP